MECGVLLSWLVAVVLAFSPHHHSHPGWHPSKAWLRAADCIVYHESRFEWHINTGNGYYGGFQFLESTWRSVGGSGLPSDASPREQRYRAWRVWRRDHNSWIEWGTRAQCHLN